MRVLLSGVFNPAFEALPEYLAAALRRLGHEVTLFDHRAFLIPGRLRAALPHLDRLDRAALNVRFVSATRRLRPRIALINQGTVLTRPTLEAARTLGVRCVNWFSDYPAEFDAGMRIAILSGDSQAVVHDVAAQVTGEGPGAAAVRAMRYRATRLAKIAA